MKPKEIAITATAERFLQKAIGVLDQYSVPDKFGPEQFSGEMVLSRSKLNRKLEALTGHSPV